jgi:hypothetical protein
MSSTTSRRRSLVCGEVPPCPQTMKPLAKSTHQSSTSCLCYKQTHDTLVTNYYFHSYSKHIRTSHHAVSLAYLYRDTLRARLSKAVDGLCLHRARRLGACALDCLEGLDVVNGCSYHICLYSSHNDRNHNSGTYLAEPLYTRNPSCPEALRRTKSHAPNAIYAMISTHLFLPAFLLTLL